MERPQHPLLKPGIAVAVIVLFHVVGLIGLSVAQLRPLFLSIVPFHITLMLLVILLSHRGSTQKLLLFFAGIFIAGIVLEWIGVHKRWIFGDYHYGATLGTKIFDIPLTIGANWFLLVYSAGIAVRYTRLKSAIARVLIGAGVLVCLDLLIEPVAIRFDYWTWTEGTIPLKNYICWFIVSAAMLAIFERMDFEKQGKPAVVLLLAQFLFFAALQLVI